MQPEPIRWFGTLYLLWIVLAIGGEAWFVYLFLLRPNDSPDNGPLVPVATWILVAVHLALNLALRHYVVARPRRIARTIFMALLALGFAFWTYKTGQGIWARRALPMAPNMIFPALSFAAQLGLIWLLYRPDAEAWLRGETPDPSEALESTFR